MSNIYNASARLWILNDDDILSLKNKGDANSGLVSTTIRMVRYQPTTTAHAVKFQTLRTSKTPTLAIAVGQYDVTDTYKITDDPAAAAFSGATAGDWVHITTSSTGNNLGWYLIDIVGGSNHYIDVAYGSRTLTNDTNAQYTIDIYTPEVCMVLVSETGDSGAAAIKAEVIDWGPDGRTFTNLAMYPISGGICYVYLK